MRACVGARGEEGGREGGRQGGQEGRAGDQHTHTHTHTHTQVRECAQAAVQQLNSAEVEGRRLLVKFADSDADQKPATDATPSDNLYVKGLPQVYTPEEPYIKEPYTMLQEA